MKKFSLIIGICILLLGAGNGYGDMAFVANVDGNWDLFVADDMGKNPFQLTTTEYDEKDPCWSFDRKKIVYATSDGHLNIVDVESGEIHRVAETKLKTPKVCPCFSPDGKEIRWNNGVVWSRQNSSSQAPSQKIKPVITGYGKK